VSSIYRSGSQVRMRIIRCGAKKAKLQRTACADAGGRPGWIGRLRSHR